MWTPTSFIHYCRFLKCYQISILTAEENILKDGYYCWFSARPTFDPGPIRPKLKLSKEPKVGDSMRFHKIPLRNFKRAVENMKYLRWIDEGRTADRQTDDWRCAMKLSGSVELILTRNIHLKSYRYTILTKIPLWARDMRIQFCWKPTIVT